MTTASVLQMLLFYNRFHRHLSTDLYETLTHDVYRLAIETYMKRLFCIPPPEKKASKTTYYRQFCNLMATLRANISGEEHDKNHRETALETAKAPNFMNFRPTAKIGP